MRAAAALDELARALDACIEDVMLLATSAATATRAEWCGLVEALTGGPGAVLPPATDAANPAEVRAVLLAVHARYEARLAELEARLAPDERDHVDDALWTFRHRRLASLVADEVAAYIQRVAPRPSIASVFAKAAASSTIDAPAASRAHLHRCPNCGAPRRAERLYGNCLYCGRSLFNMRQEIE